MSQMALILSYYTQRPFQPVPHAEVVDWATAEWKRRTGNVFRDPDRAIRQLHQKGKLQKLGKGIYCYDPDLETNPDLEDFSAAQRAAILERDGKQCVICGATRESGAELHVDHIKPKDKGGRATMVNGQTLCAAHNNRKKNYGQTETGKKMFLRLFELAQQEDDAKLCEFIRDVLRTYEKHGINGHIIWNEPGDFAADRSREVTRSEQHGEQDGDREPDQCQ